MNDLHRGVHAGVGPAGGNHFDGMIGDDRQRCFDDRLDSQCVRLRLPAAERTAVIFQAERDSGYLIDSIRRCASCF
jgi:hypothetical protein